MGWIYGLHCTIYGIHFTLWNTLYNIVPTLCQHIIIIHNGRLILKFLRFYIDVVLSYKLNIYKSRSFLTLSMLGKNFIRHYFEILTKFSQKISFDISCKLSSFTWNIKVYNLGKIRKKYHQFVVSWIEYSYDRNFLTFRKLDKNFSRWFF